MGRPRNLDIRSVLYHPIIQRVQISHAQNIIHIPILKSQIEEQKYIIFYTSVV